MALLRQIVELTHSQRKSLGLPLRQPLADLTVSGPKLPPELTYLLLEETNIKTINWVKPKAELAVSLNTRLTEELKAEGKAREIVRQIQEARKQAGANIDQLVDVDIPEIPTGLADYIKSRALIRNLNLGQPLCVNLIGH